jgi:hypothetical protein
MGITVSARGEDGHWLSSSRKHDNHSTVNSPPEAGLDRIHLRGEHGRVERRPPLHVLRQLLQQRLGLFQVERAEALGEPAVDGRENVMGLGAPAGIARPRLSSRSPARSRVEACRADRDLERPLLPFRLPMPSMNRSPTARPRSGRRRRYWRRPAGAGAAWRGVTTTKRRAITIKEAAGESGFSESGVKVRIRQGRITARKLGGHWVDDAASVARRVRIDRMRTEALNELLQRPRIRCRLALCRLRWRRAGALHGPQI